MLEWIHCIYVPTYAVLHENVMAVSFIAEDTCALLTEFQSCMLATVYETCSAPHLRHSDGRARNPIPSGNLLTIGADLGRLVPPTNINVSQYAFK